MELELQNMEQNITINIVPIDCYICFNTFNDKDNVLLKCCNKSSNKIHNECLFTLFLHSLNNLILCPLCRNTIDIKIYFNKEQLKYLYNKLSEEDKFKYQNKFDSIIPTYIETHKYCYVEIFLLIIIIAFSLFLYIFIINFSKNT